MGFRNLQAAVTALEQSGQLHRIEVEVNPLLEIGAIQRRVLGCGMRDVSALLL